MQTAGNAPRHDATGGTAAHASHGSNTAVGSSAAAVAAAVAATAGPEVAAAATGILGKRARNEAAAESVQSPRGLSNTFRNLPDSTSAAATAEEGQSSQQQPQQQQQKARTVVSPAVMIHAEALVDNGKLAVGPQKWRLGVDAPDTEVDVVVERAGDQGKGASRQSLPVIGLLLQGSSQGRKLCHQW
jgi:hypothetical protein